MSKVSYANAVGCLMYLMVCTRPDISHAVSVANRYLADPGKVHWNAVKWIFRYLIGTRDFGILFDQRASTEAVGYVDSDYEEDLDSRKSMIGYVFRFASGPICQKSTLQEVVALSTIEAEYMAMTQEGKEVVWLTRLVNELGFKQDSMVLHCDSQMQFIWQRIRYIVQEQSILLCGITRLENGFHLVIFLCQRFSLVRVPMIC